MTTVFVVYRSTGADFRFDRDYYVSRHLPLVRKCWEPYGLESATALFPAGAGGTAALAVCEFRDEEAVAASFGAPESEAVMRDVLNYTDLSPVQLRGVQLN